MAAEDAGFAATRPATHDFLSVTLIGGAPRRTGTITVFAEDGRFKVCLNDREHKISCFVASETLLGLLDAVEDILLSGKGDWREPRRR